MSRAHKIEDASQPRHHGSFVGERARCDGRKGAADVHRASRCKDHNPYLVRRTLVSCGETRRLGGKSCLNVWVYLAITWMGDMRRPHFTPTPLRPPYDNDGARVSTRSTQRAHREHPRPPM